MLDLNNINELKNAVLYDVSNPCKYYKFLKVPRLELQDVIDSENYTTVVYKISNYIINIKWNMWDMRFTMEIKQENDELVDYIDYGVGGDINMVYNPQLPGFSYKFVFIFGVSVQNRPLYIYLCLDQLGEF